MRDPRNKDDIKFLRYYVKDQIRMETYFEFTDQALGVPMPPIQKPVEDKSRLIALPATDSPALGDSLSVRDAIARRMSRRAYAKAALTLGELSYLLWATAGVRNVSSNNRVLRTVPSAGNRHSIETYLAILNVEGLDAGLYRYLPLEHSLVAIPAADKLAETLEDATLDQGFPGRSAVTFLWTSIPYRTEWRYAQASWRVILIDAGHIAQNLYLAAESIDCACCVMAAYDQEKADAMLGVDGEDEFVVYAAAIGKQLGLRQPAL